MIPTTLKQIAKTWVRRHSGLVGSVVEVRTSSPTMVLTFDDGPEPGGTDQVLLSLAEQQATATFFVLMGRVRRFPSLLEEVVAAGHEVGLHGVDHQSLVGFRPREVRERTVAAKNELEDVLGRQVLWFRPPYGRQTFLGWRAVVSTGLMPVLWGPTTWDWRDVRQDERVAKAMVGAKPGAILLGHDGFANAADGAADETGPDVDRGDLIRRVLAAYRDRGLSGCSLSSALESGDLVRAASFRR